MYNIIPVNIDIYFISNIVGLIGATLVIIVYFFLQAGYVTARSNLFLLANCLGSIMLIFSLYFHWNLSSFIIEIMWLSVSIYGIYKKIISKTSR